MKKVEINCYCKDCIEFEVMRSQNNKELDYGYCYYWDYEQGMSPNTVNKNDFCSNAKNKL